MSEDAEDDEVQSNADRVEEMGLHPGVLFEVDDIEFLSRGTDSHGLQVVRLLNGNIDTLSLELLYEDYQSGKVTTLGTHNPESEVAIPRRVAAAAADELDWLVQLLDENSAGTDAPEVRDKIREALSNSSGMEDEQ